MDKAQGFVDKAQGFADKAQGFVHKASLPPLPPSPPPRLLCPLADENVNFIFPNVLGFSGWVDFF